MPNRLAIYFIIFIAALTLFLVFDYSMRTEYIAKINQQKRTSSVAAQSAPENKTDTEAFKKRFNDLALQAHLQSEDPDANDEILLQFSQTLKNEDVKILGDILAHAKAENSERTLALELLSRSSSFQSHQALNNFAQNEQFTVKSDNDFELALRAQAIEALTLHIDKKLALKNLENVKIRTRHAFLYDRANRAIEFLSGRSLASGLNTDGNDAKAFKK